MGYFEVLDDGYMTIVSKTVVLDFVGFCVMYMGIFNLEQVYMGFCVVFDDGNVMVVITFEIFFSCPNECNHI